MIIPDIRQPEYDVQTIVPSKGLDMTSDSRRAHPETLSDCSNVQFDNDEMRYRQRFAIFSASDSAFNSSHVRAIGSVLGTFWRVKGDQIQSYDGTNWNDRKVVDNNDLNCRFKSFFGRAATADVSSTTSGTSTSRTVVTTGLTANAHAGKIVRITSGAANGQSRMITANTDTTIYVADTFDTVPTTGATFEICAKVACGYFTVGSTTYRFNADQASVPATWTGAGLCIEVHKERLFGTALGKVVFSCLWNGDSSKAEYQIPVGSGKYEPIIRSLGDSLRIYSPEWVWELYGDGPDNFALVKRSDRGTRTDSEYFEWAPENAVHDQFFISNDGVESSRRVEAMNYEPIPTSWPIFKDGSSIGKYAHLAQKDGRLYLFVNSERNGSSATSAYVYDTQATSQKWMPVWSRIRFPRSVSCTYSDAGKLYLGIGGIVLVSSETWDDFTETLGVGEYSASITTQRLTQKDSERPKTYHKARCRVTVSGKGSINVSVGFEGSAPVQVKTVPYDVSATETEYDVVAFVSKTKKDITVKIETVPTTAADAGAFRVEEIQIYHKRKTKVK